MPALYSILFSGIVLSGTPQNQARTEQAQTEQRSIDQLRVIADAIKKCPRSYLERIVTSVLPDDLVEISDTVDAPIDVTWDIEHANSVRSPEMGVIEYTERSSSSSWAIDVTGRCKRGDSVWCKRVHEANDIFYSSAFSSGPKASQFRLEFDLSGQGLELSRAFARKETETQWFATKAPGGCPGDAVELVLKGPSAQRSRPPEISETVWEAADKGDTEAMRSIGDMYYSGQPQNLALALHWYRLAAEKSDDLAQYKLASMYLQGEGVPKIEAEAFGWFWLAADKGNANAMVLVSEMYLHGVAVFRDYGEAYFWSALGLSGQPKGNMLEIAQNNRRIADAKLSRADVSAIQERTGKWIASHPRIH
jgi:hypothetical protein